MTTEVSRALGPEDLAICMALREEVFMREQGVPEAEEYDGLDETAVHLLARLDQAPAGTLRLRRVGDAGKIERVCVRREMRRKGVATVLTRAALDELAHWPGLREARLSAQVQVVGLYEAFGFVARGPVYDDVGIPHRDMTRPLP